ncbi:hypothetical protein CAPTEDRAFT_128437, partial [Capitella teleta]
WSPRQNDAASWIQIDLKKDREIGGVVTWGRGNNQFNQFVTSYRIDYRSDESNAWTDYADAKGNTVRTLIGNQSRREATLNSFPGGIVARYVRFHPGTYHGGPVLRWELLGCRHTKRASQHLPHT